MANNPQARKRARQIERHTERNTARTSRIRTYLKKVEQAIAAKDKPAAEAALREAQPEIMRGVNRHVLHRNTASRKISRLAKRIGAL
jgi:small subunit ribosomal protein S20